MLEQITECFWFSVIENVGGDIFRLAKFCQGVISVYSDVFRYSGNFLPEWTCDFLESSSETLFVLQHAFYESGNTLISKTCNLLKKMTKIWQKSLVAEKAVSKNPTNSFKLIKTQKIF